MERHLGWFVGAAGAVLLSVVSPMLLLSASAGPKNGASAVSPSPSAVTQSNHFNVGLGTGTATAKSIGDPMFTYHIRQAGVVAAQAVGGGTVNKLALDTVKGQNVWQVYVRKPQEHWVVTVSKHDYSIMKKTRLA